MSKSPADLLYEEYLGYQKRDLAIWKQKIRPELYAEVEEYVIACNARTVEDSLTQKPRVYRGQDIIGIIRDWPNLGPWFVPDPRKCAAPNTDTRVADDDTGI